MEEIGSSSSGSGLSNVKRSAIDDWSHTEERPDGSPRAWRQVIMKPSDRRSLVLTTNSASLSPRDAAVVADYLEGVTAAVRSHHPLA